MRVFLTLIYTYICIIITAKLSIMITLYDARVKIRNGPCTYVLAYDAWRMIHKFDVYCFSSSLLLSYIQKQRSMPYAQWKKKRKKRKSRNFVVLRRARLSYHYFSLPFLLDITTKQNEIYIYDLILRLEKCYDFATFAVRTDDSYFRMIRNKNSHHFTYTCVRISKKMRDHRSFVQLLFSSKPIVRELNVFTLYYLFFFSLSSIETTKRSSTNGVSRRIIFVFKRWWSIKGGYWIFGFCVNELS